MFNIARTVVVALAFAATVSLAFAPTAAQAGGFSIGISSGDAGMTMSSGFTVDNGFDDEGLPKFKHDEQFYENGFVKLNDEDDDLHFDIVTKGHTFVRQVAHDCLMVKKIELLIEQMKDTKVGYLRIGDATGAGEQQKDIDYWKKDRLPKAKAACAEGII